MLRSREESAGVWLKTLLLVLSGIFALILIARAYEANVESTTITSFSSLGRAVVLVLAAVVLLYDCSKWDSLGLTLAISCVVGLLVGFTRENDWATLGRHAFAGIFVPCLYTAGLNFTIAEKRLRVILGAFAWLYLWAFFLVFFNLASLLTESLGIVGYSPGHLLLSLAVGLNRYSPLLAISSLVLIALGNKRGVLLGALCMIGFWFYVRQRRFRSATWLILGTATAAAAVFVGGYGLYLLRENMSPDIPILSGALERVARFFQPDEEGLTYLSSARDTEFQGVRETLAAQPGGWLWGGGFGATYVNEYYSHFLESWQVSDRFQPDVILFYYLLTSGLPLALLIVGLVALRFWRIVHHTFVTGRNREVVFFLVAYFMDMVLSYQPNDPLFWLLLGYACRQASENGQPVVDALADSPRARPFAQASGPRRSLAPPATAGLSPRVPA